MSGSGVFEFLINVLIDVSIAVVAAAIGVGKKTPKKEIIKLVFKACGLGVLCGVDDVFLF